MAPSGRRRRGAGERSTGAEVLSALGEAHVQLAAAQYNHLSGVVAGLAAQPARATAVVSRWCDRHIGRPLAAALTQLSPAPSARQHASCFASLGTSFPPFAALSLGGTAASARAPSDEEESRVLISEVTVSGVEDPELQRVALSALSTKPNFAHTLKEVEEDVRRVFATGYFSDVEPTAEDTRDGVKLTIKVEANPVLSGVIVSGANALPAAVITKAFATQHGRTLNFGQFSRGMQSLNRWYEERGIFGQVVNVDMQGGVANLTVAEALVGQVNLRFVPVGGGEAKPEGQVKREIIMRQLSTKPGRVYSLQEAKRDIDAVYSMGIADDVNILPQPAEDSTSTCPKVDLTLNIVERKTGGLSAGGGLSVQGTEGGFPRPIGSFAYSQRNLFNRNQKLTASVQMGQMDSLFRVSHTDPWVGGDAYRTSRTCSLMNTRSSGNAIHGKAVDAEDSADAGDAASGEGGLVVGRLSGGVEYQRPLATGWSGTAGLNWQRAKCIDERGNAQTQDVYGSPLTFSGQEHDTMMMGLLRMVYSGKGDTQMVASVEQALPLRPDWLNFNRFRLRAERTTRVGPWKMYLCGKAGAILGDLPPYEAFPIGGTNSVRGYAEGGIGTGRNFVGATSELIFPLVKPLDGTVFVDYGSDVDSGASVLGDPAGARGKPGSGFGYGAGIRVDSPVGPLRLECAWNDRGIRRFHLGIGAGG